ncbi:MAG: bifunctional 4-hydroxy-2-oxoglutarate aldolase/2-dehydro-3-deoxy-phosphogluconate aldolase [Spirochaetaceae bacterium]|jgi:2-dehydro-3-deoxyphosphogluconate aldolase/(4S)-4-hydroxy-2-oxoglutarate aldolase|nr:bifunctional 4-hydroxy-2-oxoglutarate aldolase/2-dehydro-3-deoxy-phosphogluconate aldolase [Spirochaetaceae bacterium]
MEKSETMERIHAAYLVPVVVMDEAKRTADTARALTEGGIKVMEITLRTAPALDAIACAVEQCPEMLIGAGTVLNLDQCAGAIDRGAAFIVSPGYDSAIVDYCLERGVAVFPGCVTPTEITAALKAGLDTVKFFPANVYGGIRAIKALAAPFPALRFIPTGGVDLGNVAEYVHPQVFAIGGGWLCERQLVNSGGYDAITRTCRTSVELVKKYRNQ